MITQKQHTMHKQYL